MIKVKVDSGKLQADLMRYTKEVSKSAEDSLKEMAAIGSVQLAYRIEPYGTNNKSKDISEKAIFKDIHNTYWDVGRTYNQLKKINKNLAIAYASAMNDGNTSKAESIVKKVIGGFEVVSDPTGNLLEKNRNSRGRVKNANNPDGVRTSEEIDQLKAKKGLRAGMAKAGFMQCARELGSKTRVPSWLKRHKEGLGSISIINSGWKTVITVINHVKYVSNLLTDAKVKGAINNAYTSQIKKLKKQMEHLSKKV